VKTLKAFFLPAKNPGQSRLKRIGAHSGSERVPGGGRPIEQQEEVIRMDLAPWRPFGEVSTLRDEMDRLWDRFFGERPLEKTFSENWLPSVDISETEDHLIIRVELPGLETKDVNVSISGDLLTIKGEKKKEKEEKEEHHHYIERYAGTFTRSFRIPVNVKADQAEAVFDKGVLKVMFPKMETSRKKEIKIKVK
jgi:HSP20 family protein